LAVAVFSEKGVGIRDELFSWQFSVAVFSEKGSVFSWQYSVAVLRKKEIGIRKMKEHR